MAYGALTGLTRGSGGAMHLRGLLRRVMIALLIVFARLRSGVVLGAGAMAGRASHPPQPGRTGTRWHIHLSAFLLARRADRHGRAREGDDSRPRAERARGASVRGRHPRPRASA